MHRKIARNQTRACARTSDLRTLQLPARFAVTDRHGEVAAIVPIATGSAAATLVDGRRCFETAQWNPLPANPPAALGEASVSPQRKTSRRERAQQKPGSRHARRASARSRRRTSFASSRRRNSCSQIRITDQPRPRSARLTRRSRALLVAILSRQNAALVFSWVACLGQPCHFRAEGNKTGWRLQT